MRRIRNMSSSLMIHRSYPPLAVWANKSVAVGANNLFFSTATPVSRKKKQLKSNDEPPIDFNVKAAEVLVKITNALKPILPINANFTLSSPKSDEVILNTGLRGSYVFKIDRDMFLLTVQSPISGVHQYDYDPEEHQWLSVQDKHDMRGLVTRDLLRHASGLPKFD